jgi:hypothetical protein
MIEDLTVRRLTGTARPFRVHLVSGQDPFARALCGVRPRSKQGRGWSAPLEEPLTCTVCAGKRWLQKMGVPPRRRRRAPATVAIVPVSALLGAFHDNQHDWHLKMAGRHGRHGHDLAEQAHLEAAKAHEAARMAPLDDRIAGAAVRASAVARQASQKVPLAIRPRRVNA